MWNESRVFAEYEHLWTDFASFCEMATDLAEPNPEDDEFIKMAIVGFATISDSELCALHVDPDVWGTGVGRALIARARTELAAAGVAEAHLWLLVGNARAQRFYQRDGWTTDGTRRVETVWVWRSTRSSIAAASECTVAFCLLLVTIECVRDRLSRLVGPC